MAILKPASWAHKATESNILLFIGLLFVFYFFSFVIGAFIANLIWGISILTPNALADIANPAVLNTLKCVQIIGSIGTFILPPIMMAYLMSNAPYSFLGFQKSNDGKRYVAAFIIFIASIPIINLLSEWNNRLILPDFLKDLEIMMRNAENNAQKITEAFLITHSIGGFLLNICVVAIIPALGEELVFRSVLQKLFHQMTKNIHIAILISAILFSAMHFQFYGFIPRVLLGVFFGYLYYWSNSIWLPIFAHFINNTGAVLMNFLQSEKIIAIDAEKIGIDSAAPTYIMPLAILVTTASIWYLFKNRSPIRMSNENT